jgi:hypothetical protein
MTILHSADALMQLNRPPVLEREITTMEKTNACPRRASCQPQASEMTFMLEAQAGSQKATSHYQPEIIREKFTMIEELMHVLFHI